MFIHFVLKTYTHRSSNIVAGEHKCRLLLEGSPHFTFTCAICVLLCFPLSAWCLSDCSIHLSSLSVSFHYRLHKEPVLAWIKKTTFYSVSVTVCPLKIGWLCCKLWLLWDCVLLPSVPTLQNKKKYGLTSQNTVKIFTELTTRVLCITQFSWIFSGAYCLFITYWFKNTEQTAASVCSYAQLFKFYTYMRW